MYPLRNYTFKIILKKTMVAIQKRSQIAFNEAVVGGVDQPRNNLLNLAVNPGERLFHPEIHRCSEHLAYVLII